MLSTTDRLLALLGQGGSGTALDMDNLLLRQSLDVIGLVGFEQDMGATSSLDSSSQASNCLAVTVPAMLEVERRFGEPFRARKFWRKVPVSALCLSLYLRLVLSSSCRAQLMQDWSLKRFFSCFAHLCSSVWTLKAVQRLKQAAGLGVQQV